MSEYSHLGQWDNGMWVYGFKLNEAVLCSASLAYFLSVAMIGVF